MNKRPRWACRDVTNQCQFVRRNGSDGYLCCSRRRGHRGPHVDSYSINTEWMPLSEWNEKYLPIARAVYAHPPRPRKPAARKHK